MLQRRHEREADGLSRLNRICGIGRRHDPRRLGAFVQVLEQGCLGRSEVHRPDAALLAAEGVEANVRRDPVEPRLERGPALEAVERAPCAQHRLLDRILGLERRAEHAVAVAGQLAAVLLEGGLQLDRRGFHGGHPRERLPAGSRFIGDEPYGDSRSLTETSRSTRRRRKGIGSAAIAVAAATAASVAAIPTAARISRRDYFISWEPVEERVSDFRSRRPTASRKKPKKIVVIPSNSSVRTTASR